jgi:hypothetical protein
MSEKNENFGLKPVVEFLDGEHHFFIPSYQRGYRWRTFHVKTLLDDIAKCEDSTYCLQPLVIKWDESKEKWIVADGQQRLTTMYIILKALEETVNYTFEYETRDEITGKFLREYLFEQDVKDAFNTIDCHFIRNTFKTVQKYEEKEKLKANLSKAHFIWYPIAKDVDDQDLFDNLNSKKIPLTDAELIKALFLIGYDQALSWQKKIAVEWDMIERRLHDDKFWYFLREFHLIDKKEYPVRIELILDLCVGLYGKEKNENHETFLAFKNQQAEIGIEKLWEVVYSTFAMLDEWYKDDEIYHYAGFLMSLKSSNANRLKELKEGWENDKQSKEQFKEMLKEKLSIIFLSEQTAEKQLFEVDENYVNAYKTISKDAVKDMFNDSFGLSHIAFNEKEKQKIYDILLLFNILELKPKKNNASKFWTNRFRFDLYKQKEGNKPIWTLEHINAQSALKKNDEDIIHTIDNLALLERNDNSSNNANDFLWKRNNIRALDTKGSFIPQATKNVFLKYYTLNELKNEEYDEQTWHEIDRKCYFLHMLYTFNDNFK